MANDWAMPLAGVAILGYGFMGQMHLEAYRSIDKCDVIGIWGRDKQEAEKIGKSKGVRVFPDLESIMRDESVKIVDICTPPFTHAEFSTSASKAGKHVIVEKPMALSLADADKMIQAAEVAGKKLMVAHVLRFFPEYMKIKQLIESDAIGELVISRASRQGWMPDWNPWSSDLAKSGGATLEVAIHDIDYLMWCHRQQVVRVFANVERLVNTSGTAHDFALINIRFEDGAIAVVEGNWCMPRYFPFTTNLEISGTRGFLQTDNRNPTPVKVARRGNLESFSPESLPWVPSVHPFPVDPYYRELSHFVDCVLNDTKPVTDGVVSRKSLAVCLAALESAKLHEPVKLGE